MSATTNRNFNVLHLAAKHASSEKNVELLLRAARERGLDVAMIHAKTTNGYTPLIVAADVGNYPMVEDLLNEGAQQRDRNNFGNAALHRALAMRFDGSIDILIKSAGIDKGRGRDLLELRGEHRYTPLLAAADVGDSKWVGRLLEYGADLFAQDEYGRNIIGIAAECGYTDVIETVLRSSVARGIVVELVNHPDERGNTPLSLVAKRDVNEAAEVEVVPEDEEELAAYLEAAIARHDRDEVAPSNTAAAKNAAIAKLLIDNGANLRHRNNKGSTAVGLAVSTGNNDVAKLVLEEEKKAIASGKLDGSTKLVNIANERGLAPLGIAAISGREEAVPLLLEYDPDLMHTTSETFKSEEMGLDFIEGDTALHLALFGEKEEIAKKLIERAKATGLRALITAQNRGGTMALDLAVKKRLESATYELLRTGWIEPSDIKRNRSFSDGMFMFGAIATFGNVALLTSTLKHFGVFNKNIPDIATLFNWALESTQVERALAYIAVLLPVIEMVWISNNEKGAVFENREELLDIAFDETIHKSDDQVDEEGRLARLDDAQLAEQQIEYHTRRVYANTILTEVGGVYIECIRDPFEMEKRSEEEKSRIITIAKELDNGLKSGESTGEFDEDFLKVVAAIYVASVTESEFTDQPDSSDVRDKPYAPLHKFFDKIAAHDAASKKVLELVNRLKLNKKHDNGLVTLPLDNAGIFDKAMLARMTPGAQLTWKNLSRYHPEDAAAKSRPQAESRSPSPGIEVRDLGRRRAER